ncbi:MAG: S8/S53 family peptidase [Bacteroidota bacterium]
MSAQRENTTLTYVPDEIIVQLEKGADADVFFQKLKTRLGESGIVLESEKQFSKRFNLFLLKSTTDFEDVNVLLESMRKYPEVQLVGQNFQVPPRETTPDDPRFTDQWNMEKINAPAVWDITTGGVTALGDTIVVAMVESGDWRHEDLIDNLWINWGEINNDGIDNDGNGYVDDYFGWNVVDSNDVIGNDLLGHGIRVGGLIGATGNNEVGIAGVNWNVKIMWVHSNLFFNEIVEAYEYVYNTRKLWNDTNGERGALVVSTNASYGVDGDSSDYPDGLQEEDNVWFPLWCEILAMLGDEGVLNVGSVSNRNSNIDEVGDMPSICTSDHLVTVGESTSEDVLNSAYGKELLDLIAPGGGSLSTFSNNNYITIGGASASAPHVAGAIALLYSLPCEKLAQGIRTDPSGSALAMKSFILNGVEQLEEMADRSVSGGRLDLEKSMELINDFCGSALGILNIDLLSPNPTNNYLDVAFTPNEFGIYDYKIYNALGQLIETGNFEAKQFLPATFRIENVGRYPSGVYFLTISNSQDFTTKGFVVD